jgi:hypothetical protein
MDWLLCHHTELYRKKTRDDNNDHNTVLDLVLADLPLLGSGL